jgi:hypothetical protein
MGLLVWSEVPVYWTIAWENPETLRSAEQQVTEMISRDKNRSSVILWSVANETPIGEPRLKFLSTLAGLVRELDSTRLVTAALETHRVDANTVMVDDSLGQYLDVVSCNEYIGWYDGAPEKIDRTQWKTAFDKPFVLALATSSLPVPVSPWIRTAESVRATIWTRFHTHRKARLDPIISPLDDFSTGMQVIAVAAISYSNARRLEIRDRPVVFAT